MGGEIYGGLAVRFAVACLLFVVAPAHADLVYCIGNSLTADASPRHLDDIYGWHADCGVGLPYIYANPNNPCVTNSIIWPTALSTQTFSHVTVQPAGDTVANNVFAISQWMQMQPSAQFVYHLRWPVLSQFDTMAQTEMQFAADIIAGLATLHPSRPVTRDKTIEAMLYIQSDIVAGNSPLSSIGELYRDDVHLNAIGIYLMHNLLRDALGQPLYTSIPLLPLPEVTSGMRTYLNGVIAAVTAVPEAGSLAFFGVAGSLVCAASFRRNRRLA